MDWLSTDGRLTEKEIAIIKDIGAVTFHVDEKIAAFIKLKTLADEQKAAYQVDKVHIMDRIQEIKKELDDLLFDYLEDNEMNWSLDTIDIIIDEIMMVAKKVY